MYSLMVINNAFLQSFIFLFKQVHTYICCFNIVRYNTDIVISLVLMLFFIMLTSLTKAWSFFTSDRRITVSWLTILLKKSTSDPMCHLYRMILIVRPSYFSNNESLCRHFPFNLSWKKISRCFLTHFHLLLNTNVFY